MFSIFYVHLMSEISQHFFPHKNTIPTITLLLHLCSKLPSNDDFQISFFWCMVQVCTLISSLFIQNIVNVIMWFWYKYGAWFLISQVMRPRIKRVNMKDVQFLLENERATRKSDLLYKTFLKWKVFTLCNYDGILQIDIILIYLCCCYNEMWFISGIQAYI